MQNNETSGTPVLRFDNKTGLPIIPEGFTLRYDNKTGAPSLVKTASDAETNASASTEAVLPASSETSQTAKSVEAESVPAVSAPSPADISAPAFTAHANGFAPPAVSYVTPAMMTAASPYSPPAAKPELYENSRCAGFFRRLLAFAADSFIAWLFTVFLTVCAWLLGFGDVGFFSKAVFFDFTAANIVGYIIIVLYFIIFTKCMGTTPGKKLLRLKVVSSEPRPLSWWSVIYRETIGRYLTSLLLVGYLVLAVDPQHRGFHDMLADTRVIFE